MNYDDYMILAVEWSDRFGIGASATPDPDVLPTASDGALFRLGEAPTATGSSMVIIEHTDDAYIVRQYSKALADFEKAGGRGRLAAQPLAL
tara:strand:- start:287 stop:559 length:273 start_codon:yes stop_codon:yes gene_type:complete